MPRAVPALGAVGCVFAMFIVNPTVSLVAVGVVFALYVMILRGGVSSTDDSRSGIFSAVAEWAAAKATEYEATNPRAWKPNLLVPVQDTADLRGDFQLLHELVRPEGTIKLLGVAAQAEVTDVTARVNNLTREFRRKGVFTTSSVLDSTDLTSGVVAGLQSLRSAFFRPNVLFLDLSPESCHADIEQLWRETRRLHVGLAVLAEHPRAGLGRRSVIHLWFPCELTGQPVESALGSAQMHLAVLVALRLRSSWNAGLRIFALASAESQRADVASWLSEWTRRPGVTPRWNTPRSWPQAAAPRSSWWTSFRTTPGRSPRALPTAGTSSGCCWSRRRGESRRWQRRCGGVAGCPYVRRCSRAARASSS